AIARPVSPLSSRTSVFSCTLCLRKQPRSTSSARQCGHHSRSVVCCTRVLPRTHGDRRKVVRDPFCKWIMMPSRSNSAAAFVAVLAGMLGNAITCTEALQVTTPSVGMTVVANSPYIVSWNGASPDDRFEIDLHFCGSYSFCFDEAENCGFWIASLCDESDPDCMEQEDQASQVVLPEPVGGYSDSGYRIRIAEVGTETFRCSGDFYLVASADAAGPGEPGGPTMEVVAPSAGSLAFAGEIYTVEFDYDNGFGERAGRFKIDLYTAQGAGDCGDWVTSICDKESTGCLDSPEGDYDIVIPAEAETGDYKIRVGVFGDDSVYACSESFQVM
ncbi:unnamed protein product, partial [Scytosiphon promiscuus]